MTRQSVASTTCFAGGVAPLPIAETKPLEIATQPFRISLRWSSIVATNDEFATTRSAISVFRYLSREVHCWRVVRLRHDKANVQAKQQ